MVFIKKKRGYWTKWVSHIWGGMYKKERGGNEREFASYPILFVYVYKWNISGWIAVLIKKLVAIENSKHL